MNVASLPDAVVLKLYYDWDTWARPSQKVPPGDWLAWLLMAGRGFGKTRVGAEWIRQGAENGCRRMALVGATADDVREIMVEGESGILAVSPDKSRPRWEPSNGKLTWPNGAIARCYTAEEPKRLRGPQHDRAWCDELAAWKYPRDTWDMLLFGLRLGTDPRVVVTTTPKPISLLREMAKDPAIVTTGGSTYENLDNLAGPFRRRVLSRYEGTTLGRQELHAELFDEMPGALWLRSNIDKHRVRVAPQLARLAVAIDPAVTSGPDSAETGIVWGGLGADGHIYICGDESMRDSPDQWARRAVGLYEEVKADRIVYEANQGRDLIPALMETISSDLPIEGVNASRGKHTRAEPVAALYEQGRVHHVRVFPELEDQLCVAPWSIVQTDLGPCPISALDAGSVVATRDGWRRVLWAGTTGWSKLIKLNLSSGATIDVTPGHRVATTDGWLRADNLLKGARVLQCQCQSCANSYHSTMSGILKQNRDIFERAERGLVVENYCTEIFGDKKSDQYHPESTSITEMVTRQTMTSGTLRYSTRKSTSRNTTPVDGRPTTLTSVVPDAKSIGPENQQHGSRAGSAGRCFNPPEPEPHSARVVVGASTIVGVEVSSAAYPVYNASVEDNHELMVNGVVTHNCNWVPGVGDSPDRLDALVWLVTYLTPGGQGRLLSPSKGTRRNRSPMAV